MSGEPSRTALVVVAAEAEEALATWRRRFDPSAVERRIPAHLTVLFRLVPAATVDDGLLARLAELYAAVAPFSYELSRLESFPGVAWLAPEPAAPFHELIARARAAFPEHPPYGDPTLEPVPHCTVGVAEGPSQLAPVLAELRSGLAPLLPIRCEAPVVSLLEEHADATWSLRATIRLGGPG